MRAELIYNQWFGKAVGFTSAFIFAPLDHTVLSVCIILAVAAGHLFDLWAARAGSKSHPVPHQAQGRAATDGDPYHRYLFAALGHIAKHSGVVTPAHINAAQSLMRRMQLSAQQKKLAIAAFAAGKSPTFDFRSLAAESTPLDAPVAAFTVRALCEVAAIAPRDAALNASVRLAGLLNIAPGVVALAFGAALENDSQSDLATTDEHDAIYERPKSSTQQPRRNSRPPHNPVLLAAFGKLGLAPNSSASAAKQAYRKLIGKVHPDKLPPGTPERRIFAATQEMIALREALEVIQAQQT